MNDSSPDSRPADPPAPQPARLIVVDQKETYASVVAALGASPVRLQRDGEQFINPLDRALWEADSASAIGASRPAAAPASAAGVAPSAPASVRSGRAR